MSERDKQREEKYRQEEELFKPVVVSDLVCKDCVYRYPEINRITKCFKYPNGKPSKVIYGGECEKYSKE